MAMWVWRFADKESWFFNNEPTNRRYAQPWQCRDFMIHELFDNQRLRQGWGVPELDLNQAPNDWIAKRYELGIDSGITIDGAKEDYRIMIPMRTEMRINDIIFLPKVGNNRRSENHFAVVTVADAYRFENRGQYPKRDYYDYSWDQDYGHIIPVYRDLTRVFQYGQCTLQSGDFRAPFIKRLVRVSENGIHYDRFCSFLEHQDYPCGR